jgi:hypothetical protein
MKKKKTLMKQDVPPERKVPENLWQAFLQIVWAWSPFKRNSVVILIALFSVIFILWMSLPEKTKSDLLTQSSRPKETSGTLPELPGNTGWLFLGYYNASRLEFDAQGTYFDFVNPKIRSPYFPLKGDIIRLTKRRRVMMKNYLPDRSTTYREDLICRGYDENRDDTGVRLEEGTEVVIRDIGEGCQDASQPGNWAALWVRIGYPAR